MGRNWCRRTRLTRGCHRTQPAHRLGTNDLPCRSTGSLHRGTQPGESAGVQAQWEVAGNANREVGHPGERRLSRNDNAQIHSARAPALGSRLPQSCAGVALGGSRTRDCRISGFTLAGSCTKLERVSRRARALEASSGKHGLRRYRGKYRRTVGGTNSDSHLDRPASHNGSRWRP